MEDEVRVKQILTRVLDLIAFVVAEYDHDPAQYGELIAIIAEDLRNHAGDFGCDGESLKKHIFSHPISLLALPD